MKRRISLPILLCALLLSASGALAQSSPIKITFKAAPNGPPVYQLPDSASHVFAVRVPRGYAPWVENLGATAVSKVVDGESLIFSFTIAHGSVPQIRAVPGGLEISFTIGEAAVSGPAANGAGAGISAGANNASPPAEANSGATPPNTTGGVPATPQTPFAAGNVKETNIDLSVPESPGGTILGLTPQAVVRPASPLELATSLLSGVDQNGNFQTGVAIDTAPYLLFFGNGVTIGDYRNSYVTRLFSRSQFSFATTKGVSEGDKGTRLGLGYHLTLFDNGDPRLDTELDTCFTRRFAAIEPDEPIKPSPDNPIENPQLTSLLRLAAEACRAEARKRNWSRSSWAVGTAASWVSLTGETKNVKWNGGAVWTSFAYGFENIKGLDQKAQLILHLRHRTKEQVPEPDQSGKLFERDTTLFGSRLRFGKPTFAGDLEAVYLRDKRAGQQPDSNFRFSFGAERKIADNLYFSLSVGWESRRRDDTGKKAFVLTAFRWGYSKAAKYSDESTRKYTAAL
jgi:hypothetical protein